MTRDLVEGDPGAAAFLGQAEERLAMPLGRLMMFNHLFEYVRLPDYTSVQFGGVERTVETTVTRTPLRCTASTRRRKSPSPENSTM